MNKTKICKVCGEEKDINEFYKKKSNKDGYRNECKECKKKYQKQYQQENKEEITKYQKQYYKENKEEIAKNTKQYREENKEYYQEYLKQYYKENPHIRFNNHIKRRSKEEQQGKGINGKQWFEMMKFFDFKCAYSDIYIGGDKNNRSIDHILCLNDNGLNEIWNVVPMYRPYNSSKNKSNPMEWYLKQDFYSEDRLNKIIEWQIYAYEKWATEDDEDLILIVDII